MPKIRQMMADYFGFAPDTAVDSDEAVMHGAAIEAARLGASGETGGVRAVCCLRPDQSVCRPMADVVHFVDELQGFVQGLLRLFPKATALK